MYINSELYFAFSHKSVQLQYINRLKAPRNFARMWVLSGIRLAHWDESSKCHFA